MRGWKQLEQRLLHWISSKQTPNNEYNAIYSYSLNESQIGVESDSQKHQKLCPPSPFSDLDPSDDIPITTSAPYYDTDSQLEDSWCSFSIMAIYGCSF